MQPREETKPEQKPNTAPRRARFHWKCQKCGRNFERTRPDDPKRCPLCLDLGDASYIGWW